MKSAYMMADDFCEGRYSLKGGYAFTVDELEEFLNAFADSRFEAAASISEDNICGLDICGVATAEKIRSLKSKPSGEGKGVA